MNVHKMKSSFFSYEFKHQNRQVMMYKNLEEQREDEARMMFDEERDDPKRIGAACAKIKGDFNAKHRCRTGIH